MKVSREIPISEITLRKFEKPYGEQKELLRKFIIGIGLLQPGDSRDDIVDVFFFMLKNKGKAVCAKEIADNVEISPSNLRRHLKRLRDIGFIEKFSGGYRLNGNMPLSEIINEVIVPNIKSCLSRIREYAEKLDSVF